MKAKKCERNFGTISEMNFIQKFKTDKVALKHYIDAWQNRERWGVIDKKKVLRFAEKLYNRL